MPPINKLPSNSITIVYAGAENGDRDAGMSATQTKTLILELARALARMAAREDDAAENSGQP